MTLDEIITAAARYLEKDRGDLVIDDLDYGLVAINQVRRTAEQQNDFNFTRKLLQLSVNGVTGGSLDNTVVYGGSCSGGSIKTIVDVGIFDANGNFRAVEWTTTADSLNLMRQDNRRWTPRFPTDGEVMCGPIGQRRFTFSGRMVYYFPKTTDLTITLGIEAYTFTDDWDDDDLDSDRDTWLQQGAQYLQWQTVVQLNHLFKGFVFRQEGNLPPPEKLAEAGLDAIQKWDTFQFEQFRRHSR
jgi:hypothetical protein